MALNFKLLLAVTLLGVGVAQAEEHINEYQEDYYTLDTVEVVEIRTDVLNQEVEEILETNKIDQVTGEYLPFGPKSNKNIANVGMAIAYAKDLVALGEAIYHLVQKGKPHNTTEYAPISVIPLVNGKQIDIFDTENWTVPKRATYEIKWKNLYGMEVVKFKYTVMFSYNGSYNGKGAFLTAAQIYPVSVMTMWGFDFSAKMKLNGIMNHGTKDQPVAGAIMALEYRVENILKAELYTDSYHVTGKGYMKEL